MPVKGPNRDSSSRHELLGAPIAPGTALGAGSYHVLVPTEDLIRGKVRAQLTSGGATIKMRYPKPDSSQEFLDDGTGLHEDLAAADVVIADTDEHVSDAIEFHGEAYLLVTVEVAAAAEIGGVYFAGMG